MDNLCGFLGIVGTGTMGQELALNVSGRGCKVIVFDQNQKQRQNLKDLGLNSVSSLANLVAALPRPRVVLIMVPAGSAVDSVVEELFTLLQDGDAVVDGGNSYFKDTQRRAAKAHDLSIYYYGAGISGGKEGARTGPAVMLGGPEEGLPLVMPILSGLAAVREKRLGFLYCGNDGVGHFVKMVHNAVEYAIMQLQAEIYLIMRDLELMKAEEIAASFATLNSGRLRSSLMSMNVAILKYQDDRQEGLLLDVVLDRAKQSGTGRWAANSALELGVPAPTLLAAVDARSLSMQGELRKSLHLQYSNISNPKIAKPNLDISDFEATLFAGIICAFAEGFSLLEAGSQRYDWTSHFSFSAICDVWNSGSILEADIMNIIGPVWGRVKKGASLLEDDQLAVTTMKTLPHARKTVTAAISAGIPIPALSASLAYFDGIRKANSGANLIQAQRDCFGAHTYQRTDREGQFHSQWQES
ncbi:MAG: NADP-dependent phosphogluconate dehydrogenase [Magnetococcales bacterium]|nr:NADP-dependent phosphogluconate dehydrogenase [Magnetococcales bacterium]